MLRKISHSVLRLLLVSMVISACSPEPFDPKWEPPVLDGPSAKEIVTAMGAGFNLGNTFDNGINSTNTESLKQIIDLYHNEGMKHVRIPVTWMESVSGSTLADPNGNINFQHSRFLELKAIIDYAINLNMYVVLNTHHEHWLKDHYNGSVDYDTKFATLWKGIATHFKDYPPQLIFEVLNEPEGNLGEWSGGWPSPTSATALSYTRKVNEVGYTAIRETGGGNTTRIIMVSPNGQGNQGMIDEVYPSKTVLPGGGEDAYLAIQVHTYDPWSFCGQTGSNSAWPGTSSIEEAIRKVSAHAKILDVPINYGEFGVGRQSNNGERNTDLVRGYYRTIKVTTLAENMSFTPWDDRGWFGLIAKDATGKYVFTNNIVPTMMAP